jgi:hypothetical protein
MSPGNLLPNLAGARRRMPVARDAITNRPARAFFSFELILPARLLIAYVVSVPFMSMLRFTDSFSFFLRFVRVVSSYLNARSQLASSSIAIREHIRLTRGN